MEYMYTLLLTWFCLILSAKVMCHELSKDHMC